ncbi:MAG: lacA1 [Oscillospiraceae bacterium]|nr:lacA1 [Oscillospiraceae bacterium]
MTEKEKMLASKPYRAFDEQLTKERQWAKEMVFDYNSLRPSEVDKRNRILKELFGETGDNFFIEPPFRCDYGYNIEIGKNFYSNYNCIILDCAKVTIGDDVLVGPNVSIFTAGHPVHPELRAQEYEYAFPITIGSHVWIGGGTIINPGITIGDNVVIGAGSVVTKDIPSNIIAVGNPCRILRKITEADKNKYFKDLAME